MHYSCNCFRKAAAFPALLSESSECSAVMHEGGFINTVTVEMSLTLKMFGTWLNVKE